MLSLKVFLLLSSLILGVFHGVLWGPTLRALVDCGNNAVCVYNVFDRVAIGSVLLLARHELLSEEASELAVPGLAGLILQRLRPLYNTIIFGTVLGICLEVISGLGIILRLKILLHIWLCLVPICLGIETAIYTGLVGFFSSVLTAGSDTAAYFYGLCALLSIIVRTWSICIIVDEIRPR